MNVTSEIPNPYTAEEMASNLFQTSPVELHAQFQPLRFSYADTAGGGLPTYSPLKEAAVLPWDFTTEREGDDKVAVGYVRRDIYDAQAARVAELEALLSSCTVDLAKLDASRTRPADVFLVVERTARGGVPIAFAYSKDDALMLAELYSADDRGASYDYAKLHIGTITLDLSGETE